MIHGCFSRNRRHAATISRQATARQTASRGRCASERTSTGQSFPLDCGRLRYVRVVTIGRRPTEGLSPRRAMLLLSELVEPYVSVCESDTYLLKGRVDGSSSIG
jgi:hypothetical protein